MRRFEVGAGLGLAEARVKARLIRQRVAAGADPTAEKRENRTRAVSAKRGVGTFGAAVEEYFSAGNGAGLKTKAEQLRRIRSVFKAHLDRPGVDVLSSELQRAVDPHTAKVSAARAVAYVTPVLKWAVKRGLMKGVFDLEKPLQDAPRQKVMGEAELAAVWPTLTDSYGRCCRFMLLTGARLDEARNATWGQFNLQMRVWTIPAAVRKDTRAQSRRRLAPKPAMHVPLSQQAVALLDEVKVAELSHRQLQGVSEEPKPADLVFVGQRGGKLDNWDRWLKANAKKSGVTEINQFHRRATGAADAARRASEEACHYALLAGTRLEQLRDSTPHGQWEGMFSDGNLIANRTHNGECVGFEFSSRTASRYMEAAKRIRMEQSMSGIAQKKLIAIADAPELDDTSRAFLDKLTAGRTLRQLYLDLEIITAPAPKEKPDKAAQPRIPKSEAQDRLEDAREMLQVWQDAWEKFVRLGYLDDLIPADLQRLKDFHLGMGDRIKARLK
jgi:integrase